MTPPDEAYATPCTHEREPSLISFEVMPPRVPSAAPKFWHTIDELLTARPDFLSVTYGAGGKDRSSAREAVAELARNAPVHPIAHITCVGNSTADVLDAVADALDSGTRTFLALRGDPPADDLDWEPEAGGVGSAIELIHLIRTVEKRRCDYHPAEALRAAFAPLTIAVAAFAAGNPAAGTSPLQEAERLLLKQAAGANFAITQLFWEADTYLSFVERCRRLGVTIPIVPGILPPTELARLRRVTELSGIEVPAHIIDTLSGAQDPESRHELGVGLAASLADEVVKGGAPGVHLFTFNKARPALDILSRLGHGPTPFPESGRLGASVTE